MGQVIISIFDPTRQGQVSTYKWAHTSEHIHMISFRGFCGFVRSLFPSYVWFASYEPSCLSEVCVYVHTLHTNMTTTTWANEIMNKWDHEQMSTWAHEHMSTYLNVASTNFHDVSNLASSLLTLGVKYLKCSRFPVGYMSTYTHINCRAGGVNLYLV